MSNVSPNLGKLVAVHPTAPTVIQRAAIVAILSFLFFVGMLVAFMLRQHFMYLILAAAFFVVNIFTLIGFMLQRNIVVRVYENGLSYRNLKTDWGSIASFHMTADGELLIETKNGGTFCISRTIGRLDELAFMVEQNTTAR